MSARRCITCSRAYALDVFECPDCGSQCTHDPLGEPDKPPELEQLADASPAELWRLEQLLEAGYPLDAAEELAARALVDLHQAVDLITKHGCEPELAAQILL